MMRRRGSASSLVTHGFSLIACVSLLTLAAQPARAQCPDGVAAPPGLTLAQKRHMYGNLSTAPSYVRIAVQETQSGERLDMVLENPDLQRYMEAERGISREAYPGFMLENEGKVFDIDLEKFAQILARWRFSARGKVTEATRTQSRKFLRDGVIDSVVTLETYGVCDADALISTYFDFDAQRGMGTEKPERRSTERPSPSFIALLLEYGYVVVRGPRLYIYR